jgi:hypothetical protein
MKKLLLIPILLLSGCKAVQFVEYASTHDLESGSLNDGLEDIPFNKMMGDLEDGSIGWKVVKNQYIVSTELPNPAWGKDRLPKYHYRKVTIQNKKGKQVVLIHTYDDSEDGGNSYGWVEQDGKRVAWIVDCNIQEES